MIGTMPQGESPMYSPDATQWMVNQAMQTGFTNSDPNFLAKQYSQPGVSRSAGTMSMVMPQMQGHLAEAAAQQQQIPLSNQMANAGQLAQSQYSQGQQGLQMMDLLRQLQNQQTNFAGGLMGSVSPLFSAMFA